MCTVTGTFLRLFITVLLLRKPGNNLMFINRELKMNYCVAVFIMS